MKTLREAVTYSMTSQKHKHGFDWDYEEQTVNNMTQWEFLGALSDALEESGIMPKKDEPK